MPLNRELVGKTYGPFDAFDVDAEAISKFIDATEAGDISAYGPTLAPPMYAVVPAFVALTTPLFDGDLNVDMMRLVHGEQAIRFIRPMVAGDRIIARSVLASIEDKGSGELLTIDIKLSTEAGELVAELSSGLFIRGSGRKGARTDEGGPAAEPAPLVFEVDQKVAANQSVRYAEASGDHNPIHTDEDVAKMAGLPGLILHGLCTMAFAHNACVRQLDGRPMAVRSLAVRFSRPVLMEDVLTIEARGPSQGPWEIGVKNQEDIVVLKEGRAEVDAA